MTAGALCSGLFIVLVIQISAVTAMEGGGGDEDGDGDLEAEDRGGDGLVD